MRHQVAVRIGPVGFRIGSDWRVPIEALENLYGEHLRTEVRTADLNVRLFARRPWRRWIRPSVEIGGDFMLADALPLPLQQGLLAAEMAMNLQLALGWRRHLLLHAACVERDGKALILTGESGSGKSTLAALLGARGWRFMGDELALLDLTSGVIHPFPRLISVKNEAIPVVEGAWPDQRSGPLLTGTPKGSIRHFVPPGDAIARMAEPATPSLIVFPTFGGAAAVREMAVSEVFVRLTQASTNYVALAEPGFDALTRLVRTVPARAIDYPDAATAFAQIDALWEQLA